MIIKKERIREPVKPRKRAKEDTITDVEKSSPKKTSPYFRHKVDYEGDTNEKTLGYDDLQTGTDDCVRNLEKKHENQDDEELK